MKPLIALLLSGLLLSACLPAWGQVKKKAAKRPGGTVSLAAGKALYGRYCLTCHQADGSGVPQLNPPLYGTAWVTGDKKRLIGVILKGMAGQEVEDEAYHNVMPAHAFLSDKEVADLLTYLRASFGNRASAVTAAEVRGVR